MTLRTGRISFAGNGIGDGGRGVSGFFSPAYFAWAQLGFGSGLIAIILPKIGLLNF